MEAFVSLSRYFELAGPEARRDTEELKLLEKQAADVLKGGVDKKWDELSRILQDVPEMFDAAGNRRKIVIFTEHRDTLSYLEQRITTVLGRREAVVIIHGGLGREERRRAQAGALRANRADRQ